MKKLLRCVFILFTVMSLSCNFFTSLAPSGPAGDETPRADVFSAEATSPVSVQLTWPAVDGVEKYLIDVRIGEEDFIPLTELPADQTSFEDFPVPRETELIYRLRKVTGFETSDGETVTVTTPPATPNPITVKAKPYQPVIWTAPTPDPNNPNTDPSALFPPGFDPNNPEAFDPSSLMTNPSASEIIGPKGGAVTVTSPDGVVYTLQVPEGAVEDSIIITLTPIESIADLPLSGGMLAGVKIEPEGFILDAPATLTISMPDETPAIPVGMYDVGFAFQGEGKEFHLVPQVVPSERADMNSSPGVKLASLSQGMSNQSPGEAAIKIGVKLINLGMGRGSGTDIVDIMKEHQPSDPGDQTSLEMAVIQVLDALPVIPPRSDKSFSPAMLKDAQVYLERAQTAGSWSEFMGVKDDFSIFLEAGHDIPSMDKINNKIWDKLVEKAKSLLDKNQGKCFTVDDVNAQELAEQLWNPKSKFSSTFSQKFILKYKEPYLKQVAEDLVKKCKVTLKIVSSITYTQDGVATSAAVLATIPLKWKFDRKAKRSFLTGSGVLEYTLFDVNAPECSKFNLNTLGGSTFTVNNLEPIYDHGVLTNFGMVDYTMAGKQKKVTAKCKNGTVTGGTAGGAQGDIWGGLFVMSHYPDDMDVVDWKMHSMNANPVGIVAEKVYDDEGKKRPATLSGGRGTVVELTTFTLVVGK